MLNCGVDNVLLLLLCDYLLKQYLVSHILDADYLSVFNSDSASSEVHLRQLNVEPL